MVAMFYGFLWASQLYISFVTLYMRRQLKKLKILEVEMFYNKIKYFPIAMMIWWTPASIDRILQMIGTENLFAFDVIHIMFESSYGMCNMFIYALSPKVRTLIRRRMCKWFLKKETSENTVNMSIVEESKVFSFQTSWNLNWKAKETLQLFNIFKIKNLFFHQRIIIKMKYYQNSEFFQWIYEFYPGIFFENPFQNIYRFFRWSRWQSTRFYSITEMIQDQKNHEWLIVIH